MKKTKDNKNIFSFEIHRIGLRGNNVVPKLYHHLQHFNRRFLIHYNIFTQR